MKKAVDANFDDVLSFDIRNFVKYKLTVTREGDEINSWDRDKHNISEMNSFFRSYQDPSMVCLTSRVQYQPDLILKRDYLQLDAVKMNDELIARYEIFIRS